jgi:hypothetical protein
MLFGRSKLFYTGSFKRLIWAVWSRSGGQREKEGDAHRRLGFGRIAGKVAALEWTTAMMQMLAVMAVWTTRRSWTWGIRGWGPFPRLHSDEEWKVDWSRSPASGTSSDGVVITLGLPKPNQSDKHERVEEGEGTGPERRWGVPVVCQIRRIIVAVIAASGGRFHPFDGVSERGKERERRVPVRGTGWAMGLFQYWARLAASVHFSFLFFLLSFFFFSVFLTLLYLLHFNSKSNQTWLYNLLKFKSKCNAARNRSSWRKFVFKKNFIIGHK